jgi:hypothetical protein
MPNAKLDGYVNLAGNDAAQAIELQSACQMTPAFEVLTAPID